MVYSCRERCVLLTLKSTDVENSASVARKSAISQAAIVFSLNMKETSLAQKSIEHLMSAYGYKRTLAVTSPFDPKRTLGITLSANRARAE